MTEQAWLPQGVDAHRPTDARVHDYALGGKDNYAVDRAYAHKLLALAPELSRPPVENAKFTRRVIRHLRDIGVRQYLELGCGLPRRGNVHEVAGPDSTVVYVDYDPVAVSHYRAVLCGNDSAGAIHADATKPGQILSNPVVQQLIDFGRPVAVLMTYMLHLIADDKDPARILRELSAPLAAGSHLVLTHVTGEEVSAAEVEALYAVCAELREPVTLRGRAAFTALFDGFDLLAPGIVPAPDWRPDRPYRAPTGWVLAGVGRKP
ncbi:SAM-dependent methyltransferase [Actinoallomurus bryophytorum]|uniref:S-adenosyl methyltransferase n=1 Tax=Actinoallomurus bryophytorum TaxID=1490222 RepID=A0A543CPB7_9ACTN|nr:SAM-dependent methyltransferase [Actinoallomurus bryophytorum]TQL98810.1 S-adenosyl methyltransferase [Actinoallomurus bryophytorum]